MLGLQTNKLAQAKETRDFLVHNPNSTGTPPQHVVLLQLHSVLTSHNRCPPPQEEVTYKVWVFVGGSAPVAGARQAAAQAWPGGGGGGVGARRAGRLLLCDSHSQPTPYLSVS